MIKKIKTEKKSIDLKTGSNSLIETLIISDCPNLTELKISFRLKRLACFSCPKLLFIDASDNKLEEIYFSELPNLCKLKINNNPFLNSLNFLNSLEFKNNLLFCEFWETNIKSGFHLVNWNYFLQKKKVNDYLRSICAKFLIISVEKKPISGNTNNEVKEILESYFNFVFTNHFFTYLRHWGDFVQRWNLNFITAKIIYNDYQKELLNLLIAFYPSDISEEILFAKSRFLNLNSRGQKSFFWLVFNNCEKKYVLKTKNNQNKSFILFRECIFPNYYFYLFEDLKTLEKDIFWNQNNITDESLETLNNWNQNLINN